MQHLPTMLGPAVHSGKDTDHKNSMRVRGPNNVGRAIITDPTLLGYASAITEQIKEILRVVSSKVLLVSNFVQQLPTTRNNM